MSDFVPRETLPDLWDEILQTHWTFLETEESIQKLEERKKLEGCLKEFLCIVPHDRKFFLPETTHVLKKSIQEMKDFSMYNAMIGFESISQYANNLFTKPWRKEYRVIKMYSGFYQHEIKSNLIDADKLFEAMGYKQFSEEILMLDGPICPDQVTNVSRDAMAAYVECQIMKNIFSGLISMQLPCSWLDIYNFRELHIGGITQAVKSLAYVIQEGKYRKENLNADNCYSSGQVSSQDTAIVSTSCPSCSYTCQQQQHFSNPCSMHQHMTTVGSIQPPPLPPLVVQQQQQQQQQQTYASVCSLHPQQNIFMQQQQQNTVPVPMHPYKVPPSSSSYHHHPHLLHPSQMSHSKSLDHYVDHVIPPSISVLPHRHSFDQPHYDTKVAFMGNYDCTDGIASGTNFVSNYQSCNLNSTYNHPYNVSGNRYPLPYNISAQLNNQLTNATAITAATTTGGDNGGNCMVMGSNTVGHHYPLPPPLSATILNQNGSAINYHDHGDCTSNSVNSASRIYGKNAQQKICNHMMSNGKDLINYKPHRQYSYSNHSNNVNRNLDQQLIDFDERSPNDCFQSTPSTTAVIQQQQQQQQQQQHNRNHHLPPSLSSQNNSFECSNSNNDRQKSNVGITNHQQQQYHHNYHQQQNMSSHYDVPKSSAIKDLTGGGGGGDSNNISKNIDAIDGSDFDGGNYHNLYSSVNRSDKKLSNTNVLRKSTDKYIRNAEILEQYQKIIDNNEHKSSTTAAAGCGNRNNYDDSYDEIIGGSCGGDVIGEITLLDDDGSSGDSIQQLQQLQQQQQQRQQSIAATNAKSTQGATTKNMNKNQDGVGSFESWDYVFQNLEKHGYNKDLGERSDLLVQGLDLNLMNINGAIDKRRSRNLLDNTTGTKSTTPASAATVTRQTTHDSTATTTNNDNQMKSNENNKKLITSVSNRQQQQQKGAGTRENISSSSTTTKKSQQHQHISKSSQQQKLSKSTRTVSPSPTTTTSSATNNNNNNSSNNNNNCSDEQLLRSTLHRLSSNGILVASHCQQQQQNIENTSMTTGINGGVPSGNGSGTTGATNSSSNIDLSATTTTTSTMQVKCGPNEWSCRFCTYLNPDTRRICEMCCRSKDFILEATTNAPTCV